MCLPLNFKEAHELWVSKKFYIIIPLYRTVGEPVHGQYYILVKMNSQKWIVESHLFEPREGEPQSPALEISRYFLKKGTEQRGAATSVPASSKSNY
jgi:hypothetical protein